MDYIMIVFTMFQTRGTYKIPGGVGVGLPVVESSVDAPVEDGSGVGVAVDDDPVDGGVSKVGYGVADEPIEASAVVGEISVTRHIYNQKFSKRCDKLTVRYALSPFLDRALIPLVCGYILSSL